MSTASVSENSTDQDALREIARMQGIPDYPENEAPHQDRRKQQVTNFFLILLLLSIALELHNRGINGKDVYVNLRDGMTAVLDPEAALPPINALDWLLGIVAVARNMIPPFVMWRLALWFGARFAQAVHGVPDTKQAGEYLRTILFGELTGDLPTDIAKNLGWEKVKGELAEHGPFIIVRNGKIAAVIGNQQVKHIGGPAVLVVYNDSAVLLEQAGKLSRVLGPGFASVRRFEKVRDVVKLRPCKYATFQDHQTFKVGGMSREGIPLVWPVDVYYQINDDGRDFHAATPGRPYAFSEEAVLKASTDRWLRGSEGHDHLDWGDRIVVSDAEGTLRSIMARLPLERLIQPFDGQTSLPRQQIQQQLENSLKDDAAKHGARVLRVDLHNVEFPDPDVKPVVDQWIKAWDVKSESRAHAAVIQAEAKARQVKQLARVRTQAQEMLLAIRDGLEDSPAGHWTPSADVVSIRLIEVLQNIAAIPPSFPSVSDPDKAIAAWEALSQLLNLGAPGPTPGQPPATPLSGPTPPQGPPPSGSAQVFLRHYSRRDHRKETKHSIRISLQKPGVMRNSCRG